MNNKFSKVYSKARNALYRFQSDEKSIKGFMKNGAIPWSPGYSQYKWKEINQTISKDNFKDVIGTAKFGYRIDERIVELPWLFSKLNKNKGNFLDAGSALNFQPLLKNLKTSHKNVFISTLAPEKIYYNNLGVSYVYEDIRESCFQKDFFDEIACISTIEHVGLDNTLLYTQDAAKNENDTTGYLTFLNSLHSLLKPGGKLYLSFPYGVHKNHGWFQVFDSSKIDLMVKSFNPSKVTETIFQYKDDHWFVSDREKAAGSVCYDINTDKKYAPDYCAFSQSVACLELTK